MNATSYHRPPSGQSDLGGQRGRSPARAREAELLDEVDLRTDRTRRSWGSTVGNALLLVAFIVLPTLESASPALGNFTSRDGLLLSMPALTCVVLGAWLYRTLGPTHRVYRALDAIELCALHAFPCVFPLIDEGTGPMAGVFQIVSATFWAQGKPGRARLYGSLVAALGFLTVVVFVVRGRNEPGALAAVFWGASVLAYVMTTSVRLEGVRAQLRRDQLREHAGALQLERERHRIERSIIDLVGAQLETMSARMERDGLSEAVVARNLSESVTELVFPPAQPVDVNELAALVHERCRALCQGLNLVFHAGEVTGHEVSARVARAALRITQELVRNAVVHGRARTVAVTLSNEAALQLLVSDDGVGLKPSAYEAASGGLQNARAWVAELGGVMQLVPAPGFNTSLCVKLGAVGTGRVERS